MRDAGGYRERGLSQSIDWKLVICYLILVLIGWANIYASVHSSEPSSIFDWECRHCGYTAQMAYPTIYHDLELGFMVCLRPSGAVSKPETIPAVKELIKRSVKNPQELKEKILFHTSTIMC